MTNEESYHFDAFGYLIIRNALTPTELKRCAKALEQIDLHEVPSYRSKNIFPD